jgi:hypothetical protein
VSPETVQTVGLWLIRVAAVAATAGWLIYCTAPFYRSLLGRALWTSMLGLALLLDLALMFRVWDGHLRTKQYVALGVYALLALGAVLTLTAVASIKWDALRQTRAWRARR